MSQVFIVTLGFQEGRHHSKDLLYVRHVSLRRWCRGKIRLEKSTSPILCGP